MPRHHPANPADASEIEMDEATWGPDPRFSGGAPTASFDRKDKPFPVIAACEFHMIVGRKRFRVTLDSGNHFYLAAVWEPPTGNWPLSYGVITVAANPEVGRYQERHEPGDIFDTEVDLARDLPMGVSALLQGSDSVDEFKRALLPPR